MDSDEEASVLERLHEYISQDIRGGFSEPKEIAEVAADVVLDGEEHDPAFVRLHAARLTRELLAAQREEELSWPEVTDCDRLASAFEDLDSEGIVCRENFTCCQGCGGARIVEEMESERDAGCDVVGYAFYHMQDTESAVEGGTLYLSYGSPESDEPHAVAVAHRIVEVLRSRGLRVEWDGTVGHRILVSLDWKRRSSLRDAPLPEG